MFDDYSLLHVCISLGFKPRDKSHSAIKRRKSFQKSRRYHSLSIKYRKQLNTEDVTLEKTMVAVKTLKGFYILLASLFVVVVCDYIVLV